ncbi:hypothetical protein OOK31_03725 [Streptomyces sp. NBC_00249]|uniref:hypothetical protein n=1 Tax=Streptomyces sp. NBC_00249 TaxID=2975690 RepID=UPI0022595ACE|nr:hypothetical protein [Streptomyces sp. NBC_00249]MCX5193009.1 hypothetical protein [Streptomyces sp. NBC_00249]
MTDDDRPGPGAGPGSSAARGPAAAWPLENALFSATLLAQRLPWTDAPARALGLDALTREGLTRRLLAHLARSRSGRPVQLRTPFGSFLVPLTTDDAEALLARAEQAGALAPASGLDAGGRRYGLSPHAAPDTALAREAAPPAGELRPLLAEDVDRVTAARRGDGTLDGQDWRAGMLRLARRVVVGADAAEDTLLSEVLAAATGAVDSRAYEARAAALARRLAPYLAGPDPESLAGRLCARGLTAADARTVPVVAHALALVSEAASTTALQALALLAARAAASPDRAVALALRRYPPVAAAAHPVRAPFTWRDLTVDPGTEILCAPALLPHPPGEDGPGSWPAALCTVPGGCAWTPFAALVAEQAVRAVVAEARPVLISPRLEPARLPDTLAPHGLLVALTDPEGRPTDARVTVGLPAALPVAAPGYAPASYGALARASADRLERHAESLAACAGNTGWNGDEAGERFRMVLLGHADRCAKAASEVRAAAQRLSG